jgi:NAD(P)-dependent dehydrogenase (short-subunit alcohol dehydrogenase family)
MKIALVTGSSRGIGAGIAKYLAGHDFKVYVTYLKEGN